jgi:GMP reductase
VAKAFGAGADFVMVNFEQKMFSNYSIFKLGGLLAGHDQSGGEIIEKDGRKVKK